MKKYYNRQVQVDGKEVTRVVTEKHGVATINYNGTKKEVAPVNGSPLNTQTKWTEKAAQA
jgi:hypothetical protein